MNINAIDSAFLVYQNKVDECCLQVSTWCAAHRALLELAATFAVNVAVITFVASPLITTSLLAGAILNFTVSTIIHSAWKIYKEKSASPGQKYARFQTVNTLGTAGPNIAIHEAGHAISALGCFKNAKPAISITPFSGGSTSYTPSYGLTGFGKLLGKPNALLVTAAAGIMASTVFGMFEFALAYQLKDKHPALSEFLTYHGISQILNDVLYGLSAFVASSADLSHDFIRLWVTGGIHPLIPIACMIALPLIEILILEIIAQSNKAKPVRTVAEDFFI